LLRNYTVRFPNQVWSIDITYIKVAHGHMYLTSIIDWYSRKIVGWKLSDTLSTEPVLDAVKEAVAEYGCPAILNSDQGSQFTSDAYKALLKGLHIRQSMDGKSRWADNIMIERWFRSLKVEYIYINEFPSPRALRIGIAAYIHGYNTIRPHEALDYATPDQVYYACFRAVVA
jgi:putative transposase